MKEKQLLALGFKDTSSPDGSIFNDYTVAGLAEVPHSRNFGVEQELSCGILANRCYAYVPTYLAGS